MKPIFSIVFIIFSAFSAGAQDIAIGLDSIDETPTGNGLFVYAGKDNPKNDTLCGQEGHVFKIPYWEIIDKNGNIEIGYHAGSSFSTGSTEMTGRHPVGRATTAENESLKKKISEMEERLLKLENK